MSGSIGPCQIDTYGEVYSLARQIGLKKTELSRKLGKTELLPSVAEAKQTISGRLTKQFKGYSDELNSKHKREMTPLVHARQTMTQRHRVARTDQKASHEKRWQAEELQRSARLRKGFKGIWDRLTGTHQRTRAKNKAETLKCQARDRNEKETLIAKQLAERKKLQSQFKQLRQKQLTATAAKQTQPELQSQFKQLRQKQTGERAELFKGMDKQYQKLGHQNEIRKLWEQEKQRMRQTIKNRDSTDHDPEI